MKLKYDMQISNEDIIANIDRITNQIFKLLPNREEGREWEPTLRNLILELVGMDKIFVNNSTLFSLLCKLEALSTLNSDNDFLAFRRTIFECLELCSSLKKEVLK